MAKSLNSRGLLPPVGAAARQRDLARLTSYVLEHYPAEGWQSGERRLRWQAVNRLHVPLSYLSHLQVAWDTTAQHSGYRSLTAAADHAGDNEVRRLLATTVDECSEAGHGDGFAGGIRRG